MNLDEIVSLVLTLSGARSPVLAGFLIALVSNAIPYLTVPYLGIIAGWGIYLHSLSDKVLVVLSAGVGAAAGKVIVFLMGRGFRHVLSEESRENLEVFANAFKRSVFLALFLFAALPLPDDVLYIPLGVTGYNIGLFFLAVALGKIVITFAALSFGDLLGALLGGGGVSPEAVAALVAASIAIAVIMVRMNWVKVVEAYNERGLAAAFAEMVREAGRAVTRRRAAAAGQRRGERREQP